MPSGKFFGRVLIVLILSWLSNTNKERFKAADSHLQSIAELVEVSKSGELDENLKNRMVSLAR